MRIGNKEKVICLSALLVALTTFLFPINASADPASSGMSPAKNYMLDCQGCHMPDGSGYPGRVPALRGNVARYLSVPEGRSYIVQVPGSAQSMLSNQDLTDVLNWIVRTMDPEHLPANFVPYQVDEVAALRKNPLSAPSIRQTQALLQMSALNTAAAKVSNPAAGNLLGTAKY